MQRPLCGFPKFQREVSYHHQIFILARCHRYPCTIICYLTLRPTTNRIRNTQITKVCVAVVDTRLPSFWITTCLRLSLLLRSNTTHTRIRIEQSPSNEHERTHTHTLKSHSQRCPPNPTRAHSVHEMYTNASFAYIARCHISALSLSRQECAVLLWL